MVDYVAAERLNLKTHPEYNEKWVQARIAENVKILGLGDLVLLQQERIQPGGGRLDLLFQDVETKRRYEIELQLGTVDESHIIRTVEYWDIERKRYPQYDHCAVIIAEEITGRFLNVISLFNGTIPLIVLQVQAYNVGNCMTLIFTKVMDEMRRGLVDDDESAEATPTDRSYWEGKSSKATVVVADQLLSIVKEYDPALELKFNKFYIGISKNNRANNFVSFVPRKNTFTLQLKIPESDDVDGKLQGVGLEVLGYDKQFGNYNVRLGTNDVSKHKEFLRAIMKQAYDLRNG